MSLGAQPFEEPFWFHVDGHRFDTSGTIRAANVALDVDRAWSRREGHWELHITNPKNQLSVRLTPGRWQMGRNTAEGKLFSESRLVSRDHLAIDLDANGSFTIQDRSANGTWFTPHVGVGLNTANASAFEKRPASEVHQPPIELESAEHRMRALYLAQAQSGGFTAGAENVDAVAIASVAKGYVIKTRSTGVMYDGSIFEDATHFQNQDSVYMRETPMGTVLAVFDGVGGEEGGRLASTAAREALDELITNVEDKTSAQDFMDAAMPYVSMRVNNAFENVSADTTGTIVLVQPKDASGKRTTLTTSAGDSLAFTVKPDGTILQLTIDDSEAQLHISPSGEESRIDKPGNAIYGSVRYPPRLVASEEVLEAGDVVLLTSDGILGDNPNQQPVGGIAAALRKTQVHRLSTPEEMLRLVLGSAKKIDDRSMAVLIVESNDRWLKTLPSLEESSIAANALSEKSIKSWDETQTVPITTFDRGF